MGKKTPKGIQRFGLKDTNKILLNLDVDKNFNLKMFKREYWENLIKKKFLREHLNEPYARYCNLPRIFYVYVFGVSKKDWGSTIRYLHKIRVEPKEWRDLIKHDKKINGGRQKPN